MIILRIIDTTAFSDKIKTDLYLDKLLLHFYFHLPFSRKPPHLLIIAYTDISVKFFLNFKHYIFRNSLKLIMYIFTAITFRTFYHIRLQNSSYFWRIRQTLRTFWKYRPRVVTSVYPENQFLFSLWCEYWFE